MLKPMSSVKDYIQNLIANGQTEEALEVLSKYKRDDAIMLQARYNNGKKRHNMGLDEASEWSRVQAQVNYALLELAGGVTVAYVDNSTTYNTTVININMTSVDFRTQVENTDLDTLIQQCNTAFKNTDVMRPYLRLRAEYTEMVELGEAIPPGFIADFKEKLVKLYIEFIETQQTTRKERMYRDLTEAHAILSQNPPLTKKQFVEAANLLIIFLNDNKDRFDPNGSAKAVVKALKADLDSEENLLIAETRPERYQEVIDRHHRTLVGYSNRFIGRIEK
jgi:hypothetical protein